LTADNHVKICDFGLAAVLPKDGSGLTRICGTPNNISPEILACWDFQNSAECMDITEQDKEEVGYDHRVDIWSLGVVIYTLAYGKPPFETGSVEMTYQRIRDVNFYFPDTSRRSPSEGGEVSDAIKDMIRRILKKNPDHRPMLSELLAQCEIRITSQGV
jgi:polo-like kinase 1